MAGRPKKEKPTLTTVPDTFEKDESYKTNFSRWYRMNCAERSDYKEELYSEREGKLVFDKMFKRYDK